MADRPFSSLELAEPGETEAQSQRLLAEQLRYVRTASAFYRRKLGDSQYSGAGDFAALPFTTKDELREAQAADPPFGEVRAAPQPDIVRLHVTSGTSGRPLAIGFTRADHELSCEIGARAYFAAGIRAHDTVLHCLNYALYVGGLADHLSIERIGATMIPVGIGQTDRILGLWDDLKPTVVFCTPSYARHLAETALASGREPATLGLRLLVVGGESGGDIAEIRQALQDTWHAEIGDTYGLGEVWPTLAGQCEERDGLHISACGGLWWELIDPATGEPLPREPGSRGEIVYTHLQRQATPLVRYRSGDVVEVLGSDCRCGRRTPRIRLLGRSDSMFIVRGVNVFPQAVEAVLDQVAAGHGAFAVLADGPAPRPPVPLFVEVLHPTPELAARIRSAIRSRLQFSCDPRLVAHGSLGLATEHKSQRLFRTDLGQIPPGLATFGKDEVTNEPGR